MKRLKKFVSVLCVVFIVMNLVSCDFIGSDKKLTQALEACNTAEVERLYRDKYSGNYSKQQKFITTLLDFDAQTYDDYNNGVLDYTSAKSRHVCVHTVVEDLELQAVDFEYTDSDYAKLKASKDAYEKGLKYIDSKEYTNAVNEFTDVIAEDKNYSDANERIKTATQNAVDDTVSAADTLANQGNYSEAINKVNTALSLEALKGNGTLTQKLEELKTAYAQYALVQAESSFSAGNYQQAINHIEGAIEAVGSNAELELKLAEYKEYIPVSLTSIETSEKSKKTLSHSNSGTDQLGNKYTDVIYAHFISSSDPQYEVYPLQGKYNNMSFKIFRNNAEYTQKRDYTSTINIYGDNILLYTVTVDKSFEPQSQNISVTGVRYLKVEFVSEPKSAAYWSDMLPGEMAEAVLSK